MPASVRLAPGAARPVGGWADSQARSGSAQKVANAIDPSFVCSVANYGAILPEFENNLGGGRSPA